MPKISAAVKAVIQYKGKFLILKQNVKGEIIWDLPGGKVEYKEDPYKTLYREVKEETGLIVSIIKALGIFYFFRASDSDQIVITVFLCAIDGSAEVDITKNPINEHLGEMKIDDFKWVTKKEFLTNEYKKPHESLRSLIEREL